MQIKIRYDNSFQTVEVTEAECESMIRNDYEERCATAADPSTVQLRTMQEIMDERFNKPEYNNGYCYRTHTIGFDDFDFEGDAFADESINVETDYEVEELYRALSAVIETLQPHQQDLIRRVFVCGERPSHIAKELGIARQSVNDRLNTIYAVLRKELKKSEILSLQMPFSIPK